MALYWRCMTRWQFSMGWQLCMLRWISIVSIGSWFSLLAGVVVWLLLLVLGPGVENPLSLLIEGFRSGLDLPLVALLSMLWFSFTTASGFNTELSSCPLHNIVLSELRCSASIWSQSLIFPLSLNQPDGNLSRFRMFQASHHYHSHGCSLPALLLSLLPSPTW